MATELLTILAAVSAATGVTLGEVFDVWYDMTHAEATIGAETVATAPARPLAFGYAKLYFREVLLTPDAFEHYHWGLWLATNAVTIAQVNSLSAFLLIGVAVSLILDENRRGLADRPFGVGKPYFATSAALGLLLAVVLALRLISVSTPHEYIVSVISFTAPFIAFAWLWVVQWLSVLPPKT